MALTSASTLRNAFDQYADNLLWEGDLTKAAAALEAVRFILMKRHESGSINGRNYTYASLEKEKEKLEKFLTVGSSATGGKVAIQIHHFAGDYVR